MNPYQSSVRSVRRTYLPLIAILLLASCQKELILPKQPEQSVLYVRVPSDTFPIFAFYGQQKLIPPQVGTVIFPLPAYNVPAVNKLAFMSAYDGRNGYGDSAGTTKKNALNEYNGEFYNTNVNASPNARITVIPINRPKPESNFISDDSAFAFAKFFKNSGQVVISISLVNGAWEHRDTIANKQIIVYQMNPLLLVASESVETGLATRNGVQKIANGQSEFYMAFVNQRSFILQKSKQYTGKPIPWLPHLYSR